VEELAAFTEIEVSPPIPNEITRIGIIRKHLRIN
jgi:hypothetical protein